MKKLKQDKVKRGRIILSAILTFCVALLSLGFGAYLGYVTLNINYITIGTMTPYIGGLLVIAGFFIFFGCVGGVIALKEIFISSRNEEKFSAYKGALISAIVYYCIIAIICIVGIIMAIMSYVPSSYTWTIVGLSFLTLVLCGSAFYCVFRELREHKKKKKKLSQGESGFANLNLSATDIHKLSDIHYSNSGDKNYENQNNFNGQKNLKNSHNNIINDEKLSYNQCLNHILENNIAKNNLKTDENDYKNNVNMDFVSLAEKLMQLEELRKAGLINDQEYQTLKQKCI